MIKTKPENKLARCFRLIKVALSDISKNRYQNKTRKRKCDKCNITVTYCNNDLRHNYEGMGYHDINCPKCGATIYVN